MIRRTTVYVALAVAAAVSAVSPANADPAPYSPTSTTIDFPNVAVNTTQTKPLDITLASGYLIGVPPAEGNFTVNVRACDALTDGGTCRVTFSFTPDEVFHDYAANYRLNVCPVSWGVDNCDDTLNSGYIDVLVTGEAVSSFAADPTSIDTGDVALNTSVTHDVTFTVDSGYAFGQANYGGTGADLGFDFGTCGGFVGPGTCTAHVRITPNGARLVHGISRRLRVPGVGRSQLQRIHSQPPVRSRRPLRERRQRARR